MKRYYWLVVIGFLTVGSCAVAQSLDDQLSSFFMGRIRYSKNDGKDCTGVGRNMTKLVSQVSTITIGDEKKIALTDAALFETPFLFMNGHNDFVLTDAEVDNLRIYLEHGGFLFTSGCCTNPAFSKAWRREMQRVFTNQSIKQMPYEHPIYRAFYRVDQVRSLHTNQDVFLEGLYYNDRLVAVMCENGLCCAFAANNSCNVGRGISPADGKKLALNIAVYAMTH